MLCSSHISSAFIALGTRRGRSAGRVWCGRPELFQDAGNPFDQLCGETGGRIPNAIQIDLAVERARTQEHWEIVSPECKRDRAHFSGMSPQECYGSLQLPPENVSCN